MMKLVIFLKTAVPEWNPPDVYYSQLQQQFPQATFIFPNDAQELLSVLAEAEVLFSWVITQEMFDRARHLKWFHSAGIQYGHLFPPEVFDRIIVTNSKGVHAEPVSQHLMDMILTLVRRTMRPHAASGSQQNLNELIIKSLVGATLGIVGLGANGTRLAQRAHAFGMNIVATRRHIAEPPEYVTKLWPPEKLEKLLTVSNIIALTAPLTSETEGLINEKAFSLMKKGCVIVSASRPQLIDEKALLGAIEAGIVAGLGIDDMWPKESSVLTLPHVVVTPHITPNEPGTWERLFELFTRNLELFLSAKPVKNRMDKVLLY